MVRVKFILSMWLILIISQLFLSNCSKNTNPLEPNASKNPNKMSSKELSLITGGTDISEWTNAMYSANDRCALGDVNGDGKADLVYVQTSTGIVYVALGTGDGFPTWTWNSGTKMLNANDRFMLGDVNGDGKADLVKVQAGTGIIYVAQSTGQGFPGWTWNSGTRMVYDADRVMLADVNGDGKADLVAVQAGTGKVYVALSTGQGFSGWTWISGSRMVYDADKVMLADVNGDGKADLVAVQAGTGKVYVALGNGQGFPGWTWISGSRMFSDNDTCMLADVNGDGKADLVGVQAGTGIVYVALSTGQGFPWWTWNSGIQLVNLSYPAFCADILGNGKADLVNVLLGSQVGYIYYNNYAGGFYY